MAKAPLSPPCKSPPAPALPSGNSGFAPVTFCVRVISTRARCHAYRAQRAWYCAPLDERRATT